MSDISQVVDAIDVAEIGVWSFAPAPLQATANTPQQVVTIPVIEGENFGLRACTDTDPRGGGSGFRAGRKRACRADPPIMARL
jgi:hypothetical protein